MHSLNSAGGITNIAGFLGYDISPTLLATITDGASFQQMKDNPSTNYSWFVSKGIWDAQGTPFLRKGVVGDWKNFFTKEQSEIVEKEYSKRLSGTGLHFDFDLIMIDAECCEILVNLFSIFCFTLQRCFCLQVCLKVAIYTEYFTN